MKLWRVQNGFATKWFAEEADAREWAEIAFDTTDDGIPFVNSIAIGEALSEINAKYLQVELTRLEMLRKGEMNDSND